MPFGEDWAQLSGHWPPYLTCCFINQKISSCTSIFWGKPTLLCCLLHIAPRCSPFFHRTWSILWHFLSSMKDYFFCQISICDDLPSASFFYRFLLETEKKVCVGIVQQNVSMNLGVKIFFFTEDNRCLYSSNICLSGRSSRWLMTRFGC